MIEKPKTKIVATVGPATLSRNMIENLIIKGVSLFRINFSHSSHVQAQEIIYLIRESSEKLGITAGIIGDLQGPKIRIGILSESSLILRLNSEVLIINSEAASSFNEIPLPDKEVYNSIKPDQHILLGDGEVELKVTEVSQRFIKARVINEGSIKSQKGFHLPGQILKISKHIKKDMEDFLFCVENQLDFIMLSFVQTKEDILFYKKKLKEMNAHIISIGSKIETRSSIDHLDEIIVSSDFVVVARGDLAIETSYFDIPILQKSIIQKSNKYGTPVIVATQMLESMINNQEPTRAEISDIANAILDGADAVMLSGETAIGKYPEKALEILAKTACKIEVWVSDNQKTFIRDLISDDRIADSVSKATMLSGNDLNAQCLICTTKTGKTARLLSRYRPKSPILAFTYNRRILNQMLILWGVYPFEIPYKENFDHLMDSSIEKAVEIYSLKTGDMIIYSAGILCSGEDTPQTNFLHIRKIK